MATMGYGLNKSIFEKVSAKEYSIESIATNLPYPYLPTRVGYEGMNNEADHTIASMSFLSPTMTSWMPGCLFLLKQKLTI